MFFFAHTQGMSSKLCRHVRDTSLTQLKKHAGGIAATLATAKKNNPVKILIYCISYYFLALIANNTIQYFLSLVPEDRYILFVYFILYRLTVTLVCKIISTDLFCGDTAAALFSNSYICDTARLFLII